VTIASSPVRAATANAAPTAKLLPDLSAGLPEGIRVQVDRGVRRVLRGFTCAGTYDVVRDHGGDTIECRLVHTSSATVLPKDHCPHAPIRPSQPWCINAADAEPTCDDYCTIELAACTGGLAQYQSTEQCKAVCEALDRGTNDDEGGTRWPVVAITRSIPPRCQTPTAPTLARG